MNVHGQICCSFLIRIISQDALGKIHSRQFVSVSEDIAWFVRLYGEIVSKL